MEVENQVSFISPILQNTQFGNIDDETTITFKEDADTPMTIDASAPGDVIELSDDFNFDGYQVVRREFFAHTFEPSITFNNYKVYVNTACLNKFPHADCAQLLINRESHILALRPCAESERDAFAWCNTSGGKRKPRQVTGKFFFAKLFELMDWNIDYRYKLLGKVIHANDEYLIDENAVTVLREKFNKALGNDLNTSLAITALYDVLKYQTNDATKRYLLNDFDQVLSLDLLKKADEERKKQASAKATGGDYSIIAEDGTPDAEIEAQIRARYEAKKAKNFAEADRIREALKAAGVEVTDVPGGAKWKRI